MHANAPLTPEGRLRLCRLIEDGWPVATAAESMRISRQTAHKWWRRYLESGPVGLVDRSSRPRRCPTKTPAQLEHRVVELRRRHQLCAGRLAPVVGIPASTLHRIWQRNGVSRLSDLARRGGRTVRRIETFRPGELIHMDVKKLAKIPPGGGWRTHGRAVSKGQHHRTRVGYAYIHSAVDAYSRLAYSEVHADERSVTNLAFFRRAKAFFAGYGITIERVISDNGPCYRADAFAAELLSATITHTFIRPYRPQTNGKVERYNRTLLNEWAYARPYRSDAARTRALDKWLHMYNHHRHHTAIGGPPVSRVNNLAGHNT